MRANVRRGARSVAALAVLALWQTIAVGQSPRPTAVPPRPVHPGAVGHATPPGGYRYDSPALRRVQATPADTPPGPGGSGEAPGLGATVDQPGLAIDAPGPAASTGNLALPAAARSFGGGEAPTVAAEEEQAEQAEPTLLMKWLGMEDSPVKIYGWIENGFTANANGNGRTRTNFGVNPNNQANEWMGNQYYLILEDPLEQEDEVNFGYRVDNLFGNDWAFNFKQGFLNNAFRPPGGFAGYDLAQVYGEVHLPDPTGRTRGMDIKGGSFYTLMGYEVVPAIGRPLYSGPYTWVYGEPFQHVGVMTTWHLTERINVMNGAVNGWDRWFNTRYRFNYHGGFTWTSEDEKWTLAVMNITGPNQFPSFLPANQQIYPTGYINIPSVAGRDNPGYEGNIRSLFTIILTHKWSDKLTQVIENDDGWEQNVPGLASPVIDGVVQNARAKDAQWQSFVNYFLYSFSDKLTGVWRSEVFWDQQGARTLIVRDNQFKGDRYYDITLGLIYKPQPWLWVRPEARYDWAQFGTPYADGTRSSQFTFGFDVIFLF